ncbi:hypothetical protein EYZ11_012400 [Aspergillus tanneri]|uniref:Uncharacterized protein n=1 Tax=Aspergillus tanneri TaxID=1220188 RepID=A0A4S3J5Q8_9EURO|nr:hypothetical protein EYZ11_012400 [Aspergillus tanneri]
MNFAPALPLEVFDLIFSYFKDDDKGLWYRLSLINHNWYAAVTPRLYHTFKNNGDYSERERLWQFLQTVIASPELAAHVKTVDLQHCLKYTGPKSFCLAQFLCSKYQHTIQQGIARSGLSDLQESPLKHALLNDDRRPLVAMILAFLPALETLYMHVSEPDPYLRAIFPYLSLHSLNGPGSNLKVFQQLKPLFLAADEQASGGKDPIRIDGDIPFVYFPALHELNLLHVNLNPHVFSRTTRIHHPNGVSPLLSNVSIVLHKDTKLEGFMGFLECIPHLINFSVSFSNTPDSEWAPYGRIALWKRLSRFESSLRSLDLYGMGEPSLQPDTDKFCAPVWKFSELKSLYIEPTVLAGNCVDHKPPVQLMHHLPGGLKHLGFYGYKKTACRQKGIPLTRKRLGQGGLYSEFARSSFRHSRPYHPGMQQALLDIAGHLPRQ